MVDVSASGDLRWSAAESGREVGWLRGRVRPDRRRFLFAGPCSAHVFPTMVEAAVAGTDCEWLMEIGEDDAERLVCLAAVGFVVGRREHHYAMSTDPQRNGLASCRMPRGISVLSAADAEVDRWRLLDDALRQDVPGTSGWCNDPDEFAAETFGDPEFDPATYLIAVDDATDAYVGLVRVWNRRPTPHLGLIGVTRGHRRHGLARALLAAAFHALHERGESEVSCEVDAANTASDSLMASLGARRCGGALELVRRP